MKNAFQKRRDYVHKRLNELYATDCSLPQGAFYAFPNVSRNYNKKKGINSSFDFCNYMLENFNIAIVPGAAFGLDNYVRLSFAASQENLIKALNRLKAGIESIWQ